MPSVNANAPPNDLQAIADRILELKIGIKPAENEIEELAELLRIATTKAGEPQRFASSLGMVETKRGAAPKTTPAGPVFHPEAWDRLLPANKKMLINVGIVTMSEETTSNGSKPAVTIRPIYPAAPMAVAA